jgi:hypothetical protein
MLLSSLVLGALVCGLSLPARGACPPVTDAAAKKYARVELRGTLHAVVVFTNRPVDVESAWLEVGGKRHSLHFQNRKDRLRAAKLVNEEVIVRGWQGHDGSILVTDLELAPQRIKLRIVKGGGIAGFRFESRIDSDKLTPEQARELRKLIDAAHFFELPAQFPDSGVRDGFGYHITVEVGGKKHSVNVDESLVPKDLLPLINWKQLELVRPLLHTLPARV